MRLEPAALPASQADRETSPPFEQYIGAKIAKLVGMLGLAMVEHEKSGLTPATKERGATMITELIPIRLTWPDFDAVAHKFGLEVLREHCAVKYLELEDNYLAEWIEVALKLMTSISRKALN
jgi:hypothetical protein